MELRHLRYFVAVAEERSLTAAAEKRLHTAQPSLSRQIRDLEQEIGAALLIRHPRGIGLTHAGRVFLDHARLILAQVEAAEIATRQAAKLEHRRLALGFLSGCEPVWLPGVMHVLRDELRQIDVTISSKHSPQLAEDLVNGRLDAAFMRPEEDYADLAYTPLLSERIMVVLPSDHRLAAKPSIAPSDLSGETVIGMAHQAPVLRKVTENYIRDARIDLRQGHRVEYITMAISLVASTRSIIFLPEYTKTFLTWSVICKPLSGNAPTVDLVLGHHKSNRSPVLGALLSRVADLRDNVFANTKNN